MDKGRNVPADRMREAVRDLLPGRAGGHGVIAEDSRLFLQAVLRRAQASAP